MAQSYYKLEASNVASSQLEFIDARPSCLSLILENPEFNLKYLRFAFQQDFKQLCKQILEALYQQDNAKDRVVALEAKALD